MKNLAIFNLKGGVGKTVSAVNLSCLAAASGVKTVLWDLDPQASSAWYLGTETENTGGMKRLARGKTVIGELIRHTTIPRLDLLAGGLSSLHLDSVMANPMKLISRLSEPLAEDYQLLVFDCPAGLQAINMAVLDRADIIAVPMIPTTLSIHTYEVLIRYLAKRGLGGLRLFPFLTQVDRRRKLHRELVELLPGQMRTLLHSTIPYASAVEQMGPQRRPLMQFAPQTPAALAYASLWSEISALLA